MPPLASQSAIHGAAPACGQCEAPVVRVEQAWHMDEDGVWRLVAKTVCRDGHRVLVEPF